MSEAILRTHGAGEKIAADPTPSVMRRNCWKKLKTEDGQTHINAVFWSRMYMRPSSIGPMDESQVTSYLQKLSVYYLTHFYLLI